MAFIDRLKEAGTKFDVGTVAAKAKPAGPTTMTTKGEVRGKFEASKRVASYSGIPYAAPPVGDLRWRPPAPAERWDGVRACTRAGSMAYQRAANMELFIERLVEGLGVGGAKAKAIHAAATKIPRKQSEDCLTLNVRTLVGASDLPVMVWIHGGDHTDGSSTDPFYLSNALPQRGCVLVTINYRLGMFGFLAHPELAAESDQSVSGNYGLLDQIAALEWVRDNIEAFGGDANNVTIFGESAGGEACLNLMTAPKARGLFHKVISQSPSDSGRWLHLLKPVLDFSSAEEAGKSFATKVVGSDAGQIARLRAMDAKQRTEYYVASPEHGRHFYPAVDGVVLPAVPMTAFSNNTQAQVPLMIGYNADEGSLFADLMHPAGAEFFTTPEAARPTKDEVWAALEMSHGSSAKADAVLAAYPGLDTGDLVSIAAHCRDHMFGVHVDHASRCHASAGNPVYRYYYQSVPASPTQTAGAYHAAEIFNVFDTSFPMVPDAHDNHLLTAEMGTRWHAFAAASDPNAAGRDEWPVYDEADPKHMVFDRPKSQTMVCADQEGLKLMRDRINYLNEKVGTPASPIDLRDEASAPTH